MANKKKKKAAAAADGAVDNKAAQATPQASSSSAIAGEGSAAANEALDPDKAALQAASDMATVFAASAFSSSLNISRNKHWRYISSFHGPWLQLPTDILQALASINYGNSRPRFVDPAIFFDLVRIRQLVDEAADLSVRAASGVVSSATGSSNPAAFFGMGQTSGGRGVKLSAIRRHRIRLEAVQKLAQAYALDEIAASVATMQSASSLEDVAGLVLERAPDDRDAQYVHFFHEKIPSRHLAESTRPEQLDRVIMYNVRAPSPWRTRATVRVFKEDYEGAVADLTESLRLARIHKAAYEHSRRSRRAATQRIQGGEGGGSVGDASDAEPADNAVISSSEAQLLFQRATVYMAMACQCIYASLGPEWAEHEEQKAKAEQAAQAGQAANDGLADGDAATESDEAAASASGVCEEDDDDDEDNDDDGGVPLDDDPAAKKILKRQADMRKLMRTHTKRAIRDYLAFLSNFDYAPNMPVDVAEAFTRRVVKTTLSRGGGASSSWNVNHGIAILKALRIKAASQPHATALSSETTTEDKPEIIVSVCPMNTLFSETPVPNLPPYPPENLASTATTEATAVAVTGNSAAATDEALPEDEHPLYPYPITETATYHPLLAEALHSLLLAHCLLQTSPKELMRHVNMVARLSSLADGYPVFQSTRCAARGDWVEVLRRAGGPGWIELPVSWEEYCTPFVLATGTATAQGGAPPKSPAPKAASAMEAHGGEVPGDKDVASLTKATDSLTVRGESSSSAKPGSSSTSNASASANDSNAFSLPPLPQATSERALAISRWLLEGMRKNDGVIGREPSNSTAPLRRPKDKTGKGKAIETSPSAMTATEDD